MPYKLFPLSIAPYIIGGNPLSGGKVYSYITNTSTPKATYTDSTGGTELPNPILLDSYGLKQIWLNTDTNYKLVIKSSDDSVTYLTLDNVEGMSCTSSSTPTLNTIYDINGNELITFSATASAINQLNIRNAASGNAVLIKATGDGASANLQIDAQGSAGTIELMKAVTCDESITLAQTISETGIISPTQITTNQNNYNPTSLSTSTVLRLSTDASRNITGLATGASGRIIEIHNVGSFNIVLKDEDSNSDAANRFALLGDITIVPDGVVRLKYDSTSSRWRSLAAGLGAATQSDMETGTSATTAVTPSTAQYHKSAAKAWIKFDGTGTPAIGDSYNVTSITDNGAGDYTLNLTTSFSGANYVVAGFTGNTANAGVVCVSFTGTTLSAGALRINTRKTSNEAATDFAIVTVACFGDL